MSENGLQFTLEMIPRFALTTSESHLQFASLKWQNLEPRLLQKLICVTKENNQNEAAQTR
jgi:hypothetical protein